QILVRALLLKETSYTSAAQVTSYTSFGQREFLYLCWSKRLFNSATQRDLCITSAAQRDLFFLCCSKRLVIPLLFKEIYYLCCSKRLLIPLLLK
ncbi:hypothetical protein, partial [Salmonella sp. s55962]|uniref:hypothetical protein n=1 Tax=Salmonella sp. s55962 TaxID=3159685 RepID=UPI00398072F1